MSAPDATAAYEYASPLGALHILANENGLLELKTGASPGEDSLENRHLRQAATLLDAFFAGKPASDPLPPLACPGTPFQFAIWNLLGELEFGAVTSYKNIASIYERRFGRRTSPRAVGQAIAANPIWILIPCHRVSPISGKLGGYAGGVEMKAWLQTHEKRNR